MELYRLKEELCAQFQSNVFKTLLGLPKYDIENDLFEFIKDNFLIFLKNDSKAFIEIINSFKDLFEKNNIYINEDKYFRENEPCYLIANEYYKGNMLSFNKSTVFVFCYDKSKMEICGNNYSFVKVFGYDESFISISGSEKCNIEVQGYNKSNYKIIGHRNNQFEIYGNDESIMDIVGYDNSHMTIYGKWKSSIIMNLNHHCVVDIKSSDTINKIMINGNGVSSIYLMNLLSINISLKLNDYSVARDEEGRIAFGDKLKCTERRTNRCKKNIKYTIKNIKKPFKYGRILP